MLPQVTFSGRNQCHSAGRVNFSVCSNPLIPIRVDACVSSIVYHFVYADSFKAATFNRHHSNLAGSGLVTLVTANNQCHSTGYLCPLTKAPQISVQSVLPKQCDRKYTRLCPFELPRKISSKDESVYTRCLCVCISKVLTLFRVYCLGLQSLLSAPSINGVILCITS